MIKRVFLLGILTVVLGLSGAVVADPDQMAQGNVLQLKQIPQNNQLKLEQSSQGNVGLPWNSPDRAPSSAKKQQAPENAAPATSSAPASVTGNKPCRRPDLLWAAADAAYARKDIQKAWDLYTRMLKECSDAVRLATLQKAKGRFNRADYERLLALGAPKKRQDDGERAWQEWLYTYRTELLWQDLPSVPLETVKQEIEALQPELLARRDAPLAENIGWRLLHEKEPSEAQSWFERALDWGVESARAGLALALQQQGKLDAAEATLRPATQPEHIQLRGQLRFELANRAYAGGKIEEAQQWLNLAEQDGKQGQDIDTLRAWLALNSGDFQQAAMRFDDLYRASPTKENAEGLFYSLQRMKNAARLDTFLDDPGPLGERVRLYHAERLINVGQPHAAARYAQGRIPWLDNIEAPSVGGWLAERDKSGESGLSRLRVRHEPGVQIEWPHDSEVFRLSIPRIRLDSGAMPPNARFGSYQAGLPYLNAPETKLDAGWEPEFSWRHEGIYGYFAKIGLTPTSGAVSPTLSGKIGLSVQNEEYAFQTALFAEPVRDSILSYVGAHDPYSGASWGRVLRYGVQTQGYVMLDPRWSVSGGFSIAALEGKSVANNSQWDIHAGISRNVPLEGFRFLTLGWDLFYESYQRNLNHFTWGHGGYFSPQNFFGTGPAIRFLTEDGRRYIARGQITAGWQSVREDASPCFPLAPPIARPDCGAYAAHSSNGMAASLELIGAYLLTPRLMLSAALGWRNSESYRDQTVFLGLRYFFDNRRGLASSDLPEAEFRSLY